MLSLMEQNEPRSAMKRKLSIIKDTVDQIKDFYKSRNIVVNTEILFEQYGEYTLELRFTNLTTMRTFREVIFMVKPSMHNLRTQIWHKAIRAAQKSYSMVCTTCGYDSTKHPKDCQRVDLSD